MKNKMVVREIVVGIMEAALWERGMATQQWPVIFRKRKQNMGSSLVKGDLICHIQAYFCQNRLHAWRHKN